MSAPGKRGSQKGREQGSQRTTTGVTSLWPVAAQPVGGKEDRLQSGLPQNVKFCKLRIVAVMIPELESRGTW